MCVVRAGFADSSAGLVDPFWMIRIDVVNKAPKNGSEGCAFIAALAKQSLLFVNEDIYSFVFLNYPIRNT